MVSGKFSRKCLNHVSNLSPECWTLRRDTPSSGVSAVAAISRRSQVESSSSYVLCHIVSPACFEACGTIPVSTPHGALEGQELADAIGWPARLAEASSQEGDWPFGPLGLPGLIRASL
jgi:hypothetical protein